MAIDKLESVLSEMDPEKRAFLKKLLVGTAFTVPTIASYAVNDLSLANAQSIKTAT